MKHLYKAIKNSYDAFEDLKRIGGRLFLGDPDQSVKPNTSIAGRLVERLDTFGSDIERWRCVFRFQSRGQSSKDAEEWHELMQSRFKDRTLSASAFIHAGTEMLESEGPDVNDGAYDSTVMFEFIIQRTAQLPQLV